MRLHDYLEYHARVRPATEFGVQDGRMLTYGDANIGANRVAHALTRSGVGEGDRIACLSKNSIDLAVLYLGASKVGAVPVPLNCRLAPPEWAFVLNDCGARLLFAQPPYLAQLDALGSDIGAITQRIVFGCAEPGWHALSDWQSHETANPGVRIEPRAPVFQMYTSGTTGRPKGAVLTHAGVIANAYQSLAAMGGSGVAGERVLIVMPMYHAGGSSTVVASVVTASSMVFHDDFTPQRFLDALEHDRIAVVNVVPAMMQACFNADPRPRRFSHLRCLIYGAAPIGEATLRRAIETFACDFCHGYGQTEASVVLTFLTPEDHRRAMIDRPDLLLSAGRPLIGTELRIVGPDGETLPCGEPGEIVARGPQIMQGYWNLPGDTAATLKDGWLHTGDVGHLDADGFLFIRDRVKDMIVSGGENIYPTEVEDILRLHPGIVDAAVIAVPDEQYGEAAMAVVVTRPGAALTGDDIIAFCRGRLGGYKIPRRFTFVDQLPRTPTGKVLRRELRASYWAGRSRQVS